jgi:hypothetical protein
MAPSPTDLISLLVRGSISEGAAEGASEGAEEGGEAIGEAATNALLKKHPLSNTAVIAIVVAIAAGLLLGIPVYLCCRRRRVRSEKEMGRYQHMKSERDGGHDEEARALVE